MRALPVSIKGKMLKRRVNRLDRSDGFGFDPRVSLGKRCFDDAAIRLQGATNLPVAISCRKFRPADFAAGLAEHCQESLVVKWGSAGVSCTSPNLVANADVFAQGPSD